MHKNVYPKPVYGKESEKNNKYLTCKAVKFYTLKDEDAFFEWIKKIKCIKSFEGAGDELYLDLGSVEFLT